MGKWSNLTDAVAAVIRANGNREITGQVLQNALLNIISNLGNFASFAGVATPSTNPGTPDGPVYYFTTQAGTYTNFGALVLDGSCYVLYWNGTAWSSTKLDLPTTAEIMSAVNSLIATETSRAQAKEAELQEAVESIRVLIEGGRPETKLQWESGRLQNATLPPVESTNFEFCALEELTGIEIIACVGTYNFDSTKGAFNEFIIADASDNVLDYGVLSSSSNTLETGSKAYTHKTTGGYYISVTELLAVKPATKKIYFGKYASDSIEWTACGPVISTGLAESVQAVQETQEAQETQLSSLENEVNGERNEVAANWQTGRISNATLPPNTSNSNFKYCVFEISNLDAFTANGKLVFDSTKGALNEFIIADASDNILDYGTLSSSSNTLDSATKNYITVTEDGYTLSVAAILAEKSAANKIYFCKYASDSLEWTASEIVTKSLSDRIGELEEQSSVLPEIIAPTMTIAVVGHEWNCYYENIIAGLLPSHDVSVSISPSLQGSVHLFSDTLRINPTQSDLGDKTITINVNNRQSGELLCSRTMTMKIISDTQLTGKKVIFIGDSLTDAAIYPAEIQYNLSNGGITSIGTRTETVSFLGNTYTVSHEGRAGWASYDYTRRRAGWRTDKENPFWDGTKFNFSYYMQQQGYSGVDVVCIGLGTNGLGLDVAKTSLLEMVESIRAYSDNIIIIVSLTPPPATQDGCGYNNKLQSSATLKRQQLDQIKYYLEHFENTQDEHLDVSELFFHVDTHNDFDENEESVSARNPTLVKRQTNNVHPSKYGYLHFADAYFNRILYQLTK